MIEFLAGVIWFAAYVWLFSMVAKWFDKAEKK